MDILSGLTPSLQGFRMLVPAAGISPRGGVFHIANVIPWFAKAPGGFPHRYTPLPLPSGLFRTCIVESGTYGASTEYLYIQG